MNRSAAALLGRSSTWATVALVLAGLTAWTWTAPTDAADATTVAGEFTVDYAADGPSGPVGYGQPVFVAIDHDVDVTVAWIGSDASSLVTWTEVSSSTGWRAVVRPPTSTVIDARGVVVPLDLVAALRTAGRLDVRTGTSGSLTASVVAEAHDDHGVVGHVRLSFDLTARSATPAVSPLAGGPGPAISVVAGDRVRIDGTADDAPPRSSDPLSFGPFTLDREAARVALGTPALATAVAAVMAGVRERTRRRRSAADDAQVRHGRQLIAVRSVTCAATNVVETASIDDLVRVARDVGVPITAETTPQAVVHRVIDGATVYRFTAATDTNA